MATTPTGYEPSAAATDYTIIGRILFQWSAYAGAGSLTHQEVQVLDAAGAVQLWTSGMRTMDSHRNADGWMVVYSEIAELEELTTYKWKVRVRDDVVSTSDWSAGISFTTGAAQQSMADWRESQ